MRTARQLLAATTRRAHDGAPSVSDQVASAGIVKDGELPAGFPNTVTLDGERFTWTGKVGTSRHAGLPSAEYSSDTQGPDVRVWRRADDVVERD